MMRNPKSISSDIAFARALRNLRVTTNGAEYPLRYDTASDNTAIDLRGLSPTEIQQASVLPGQSGHSGQVLVTDGARAYWQSLPATYSAWVAAVQSAGGSFTNASRAIAGRLALGISQTTYAAKIVYLLPLLGGNLAAALVPLIDSLGAGNATNSNFVEADFGESVGLTGDGATKSLDTKLRPSDIGRGSNLGGVGYWCVASNPALSGQGMTTTASGGENYGLQFRTVAGNIRRFWWGDGSSVTGDTVAPTTAHYYGQRSATNTRELFINGALAVANSTVGVRTSGISDATLWVMAFHKNTGGGEQFSAETAAAFYLTDGTMTATEISAFHSLLSSVLISGTGR